jgi:hypothetical protein
MKYENSDLQNLMDSLEEAVQNIENNHSQIFESQQFKFIDAFYRELVLLFMNRGISQERAKQEAQMIIDNTEIEIEDNGYISNEDIIKAAKHFANLSYRIIQVGKENNIPWFSVSQCGLHFKLR